MEMVRNPWNNKISIWKGLWMNQINSYVLKWIMILLNWHEIVKLWSVVRHSLYEEMKFWFG